MPSKYKVTTDISFSSKCTVKLLLGCFQSIRSLKDVSSSVASPICEEGQSKRIFPILAFSSRFFLDFSSLLPDFFPSFPRFLTFFSLSRGGTLYWLRHWMHRSISPHEYNSTFPLNTLGHSEAYMPEHSARYLSIDGVPK